MASKYWIKLYIEILDDPKIGLMPDWLFRRFIQLLLAAGENGDDGILGPVTDLAWRLRVTEQDLIKSLRTLEETGIVRKAENQWIITNFKKRQDALTPAEKMKNYRDRKQKEDYYQSNDQCVTECVTNGNADTDTDIDTDINIGKPTKTKKSRADPRSKHPAIQLAKAVGGGRYPPKELYDDIIAVVGDTPDGQRAAECRREWVKRGYNNNSWSWLLDWYKTGIPGRNGMKPKPSPTLPDNYDLTLPDYLGVNHES